MADLLDLGRLGALRDEVGTDDFAEVLGLFLSETEEMLASLEARGGPGLVAGLHFLRGSALNVGFAAFGDLCLGAERNVAAGHGGAVDFPAIRAVFRASKLALEDAVGTGLQPD